MEMQLSRRGEELFRLAATEARIHKKPFLGTQHVLIAILLEGKSATALALVAQEITLEYVRDQAELISPAGTKDVGMGGLPQSPDMRKVLELAAQEANRLGDREICPIHLLLGMMRVEGCEAMDILRKLGANPETLRKEAIRAYRAKLRKKQEVEP